MEERVRAKVQELRVMLQADGGDLELVSVEGKDVRVRLRGACGACPHAALTLKSYVERILRNDVDPSINVSRVE